MCVLFLLTIKETVNVISLFIVFNAYRHEINKALQHTFSTIPIHQNTNSTFKQS